MRVIRRPSLLVITVVVIAAISLVVVALDLGTIRELIGQTSWSLAVPALVATAASYAAVCLSLARLARVVGMRRVSTSVLLHISFVSTALSNVFSIGGMSSYPIRTALLGRQGEPAGPALAMSLVESYLNTTAMASLVPIGLVYLTIERPLSQSGVLAAIGGATVALAAVGLMTMAALSSALRRRLTHLSIRGGRAILGRHAAPLVNTLVGLRNALDEASIAVRGRPGLLAAPILFVGIAWAAMLTAYWFCLSAVNADVGIGVLIIGVAVGVNVGLFSLVPGGLGVQDGSAAGTMALLGVPLGEALLGAVLFRVVFYFVPFFVSLPLYWPLLRAPAPALGAVESPGGKR